MITASGGLALPAHTPELSGFRAIAVLVVIVHHVFFGWSQPPAAFEGVPAVLLSLIAKGWTGVDLFFVLSGLLITGILLDTRSRPNYFRNFYARRFLRIVPVYYLVISISILIYPTHLDYFVLSFVFLANFAHELGAGIPHGPGVFWSLAIEEHFYLVWPLVVCLATRRTLTAVAVAIVLISPLLRACAFLLGQEPENQIYLFTWFRLDGLATGALIAVWLRSAHCNRRSTLKLAVSIFLGFLTLTLVGSMFGLLGTKTLASTSLRYTQMNLLFASAIVWALALHGRRATAPLRWRFMTFTAELSYCMYLIHLIVGDVYVMLLNTWGFQPAEYVGPAGAFGLHALFVVSVTYALSALSLRILERPILRYKGRFA